MICMKCKSESKNNENNENCPSYLKNHFLMNDQLLGKV